MEWCTSQQWLEAVWQGRAVTGREGKNELVGRARYWADRHDLRNTNAVHGVVAVQWFTQKKPAERMLNTEIRTDGSAELVTVCIHIQGGGLGAPKHTDRLHERKCTNWEM